MQKTIKIKDDTYLLLRELQQEQKRTITSVVDIAISLLWSKTHDENGHPLGLIVSDEEMIERR